MNMFFFISLFSVVCAYESPQEFPIDVIAFFPEFIPPEAPPFVTFASLISNAFRLAVEMINNRTCGLPDILPNTNLVIREHSDRLSGVGGLEEFLKLAIRGESLVLGVVEDVISIPASIVGNVYDVAILSPYSPSSRLGDKSQFPFFSRIFISATQEVDLLQKQLLYFSEIGGRGWTDVAVLANIQDSNIDFAFSFIRATEGNALNIVSYQQIFVEQENLEIEFNEILKSGARVIVTSILVDLNYVMEQAEAFGLVGEHYVWCSSSSSGLSLEPAPQLQGLLVSTMQTDITAANYECFANEIMANPATASPLSPGLYVDNMDTILAAAYAIRALDDMEMLDGRRISAQMWSDVIRSVSFEGTAGQVSFLPNGDRDADLEMNYYNFGGNDETTSGLVKFSVLSGDELTQVADVVWYSNSTELPDLDIRPAFHYWSCKDGERGFDETGKTISIHSPDESNVDEIDSDYHCDAFIDCQNFSDERYDCSTNYLILFIVFGIITFLLMFVVILIFLVVIIFGFILKYPRVKARSPSFLLILLISIFVGYSSIFAYFGKPHPVSCAFQPWLLGLPSVSMIAVLSVKNLRVYRIFSSPLKKVSVSDKKLFVWWLILVLPSLLIVVLWMIISTPSADFVERDGRNHYVCVTGGFTGYPGGYVFFSILVAYTAIILVFGGIISVLSRNIHPLFNESKLLTISIYNLGFLAVVIIPVFLVVQPYNPFIAWILRSCAVLYAFTTTLVVQFAPMTFSILVRDQMKSVPLAVTKTSQTDGPISG